MTVNRSLFFLIAAIVCMTISLLAALGVVGGDWKPWELGGLLSFFLSFIP